MELSDRDAALPCEGCGRPAALTPQQRRLTSGNSRLAAYRELMTGDRGWGFWLGFEAYNLALCGLGSLAGMGLRSLALPFFLRRVGKGSVLGRGVTIRQPHRISLGRSVIVDDYAVLDCRSAPGPSPAAEVGIDIGDCVFIGRSSVIAARGGCIRLGRGCSIGTNCRIASSSRLEIGESVLVAAFVYVGCGNHSFKDASRPIVEQEMEGRGGVKIGANAWIGAHAAVLDGVTVGENAIVGAHSLVRENVPADAIVAGVPARLIGMR